MPDLMDAINAARREALLVAGWHRATSAAAATELWTKDGLFGAYSLESACTLAMKRPVVEKPHA